MLISFPGTGNSTRTDADETSNRIGAAIGWRDNRAAGLWPEPELTSDKSEVRGNLGNYLSNCEKLELCLRAHGASHLEGNLDMQADKAALSTGTLSGC
jgi:hypothetical protein